MRMTVILARPLGCRGARAARARDSGADSVIIWPFASKDGPMGRSPRCWSHCRRAVSAVGCHPKNDILAAGYSDGTI